MWADLQETFTFPCPEVTNNFKKDIFQLGSLHKLGQDKSSDTQFLWD